MGENHEWWECDFTPEQPGLYFYRFEIDTWRVLWELQAVLVMKAVLMSMVHLQRILATYRI